MEIKDNSQRKIPFITGVKDLDLLLKDVYVMEDYICIKQRYNELHAYIKNIVKGCFHIKKCREYPVTLKFYHNDKEEYKVQLRHFLIYIDLWFPLCEIPDVHVMDKSYLLDPEDIPNLSDYINEKLIRVLKNEEVKSTVLNYSISVVMNELRLISIDFSDIMALSFDCGTFIDMHNDKKYHDIMEADFNDCTQPVEIEEKQAKLQSLLVSRLKSEKNNPIGVILRSGTGIKHKQLSEFMIAIGLKPTIMGEVIPKPINTSTLIGGLKMPSDYYIDAGGGTKSLIMNKKMMGKAGYFGKTVLEMAKTLKISKKVSDCGSRHFVEYWIKDKAYLKKLNDKFYVLDPDDEDEELKIVDYRKDGDLIGKNIYVRSAITCACGQNHVCATCVGATINLNWDIADGFAGFESEEVNKVVNQSILSSKHLLTTKSENIEFSKEFYKYFTFSNGDINPLITDGVENINDLAIYVNIDDISKVENMDSDSLYNTYISTGRFYVRNLKTCEDTEVRIINNKEIYITSEMLSVIYANNGLVKFKDLDEEAPLFEVVIMNNELTKPLYELMDLIDKSNDDNPEFQSINQYSNKFLEILIDANIKASMVAGELILNRLVKRPDDVMLRPNFSKIKMPKYKFYTVTKVLENNSSVTIGMGFENIKRQFLSHNLKYRTGTSYMDAFYREELDTSILERYQDDTIQFD